MSRPTRFNNPSDKGGKSAKVDFIRQAYSKLRISGLTRDPTPSDLELALHELENMASELEARNSGVGYNFEDTPEANSETGVKRCYWSAFENNLALRLSPHFAKVLSPALVAQANQSLSNMETLTASDRVNEVPYPARQPRGSGSTNYYARWSRFYSGDGPAPNFSGLREMFFGDVDDYVENFDAYLADDEDIESFDIVVDDGLELLDSELVDNDITYRVQAVRTSESQSVSTQQLTIIITTDTERVTTRRRFWQLVDRGDDQ